jgi:phosphohistidine phosphatase SixA
MKSTWSGLVAFAILVGLAAPVAAEHKPGPPPSPALIKALQQGGHVLYLRHAMTEKKADADSVNFDDCATQRNLDDQGRRAAASIGDGMVRLRIPVAEVLSSPFCRTRDTALIAFGRARIDVVLTSRGKPDSDEEQARLPEIRRLLSTPPAGGNLMLVGHSPAMDRLAQIHVDEAEMAVFKPLGDGRFEFLGRIRSEHWARLKLPPKTL